MVTPMSTKTQFNVSEFKNASGTLSFRVSGYDRDGKQVRKNFTDLTAAKVFAQKCEREYLGLAEPTLVSAITQLNDSQLRQAEMAFTTLSLKLPNITLNEGIDWLVANYRPAQIAKPLHEAVTEFLADKKQAKRSPATIQNLTYRCTTFSKLHPAKLVSDVKPADVQSYIFASGKNQYATYSDRLVLQGFFNWCMGQKFCVENPVETVEKVTIRKGRPKFLELDAIRKLLNTAQTEQDGACLPLVVLSLFAGLRPAEARRFDWKDFNPATKTLTVEPKKAGAASHRIVELESSAVKWLKACQGKPVDSGRRAWDAVKEAAGFRGRKTEENKDKPEWVADILRHTALTYHFALHDSSITSRWAGNSPEMLHAHYRGLVTKKAAQAYWKLVPDTKEENKVITLPAAAVA